MTILISSTLPPALLCINNASQTSACSIHIEARVREDAADYTCASGETIPQAVIGWAGGHDLEPFCGVSLTSDNWENVLELPVKAMVDGLIDGDMTRTLVLYERHYVTSSLTAQTEMTYEMELATISVSLECIKVIQHCQNMGLRFSKAIQLFMNLH